MTEPIAKVERLSREKFLAHALEVLSKEGEAKLRLDRLVDALGVTKGSFYWHFDNRADFVHSLAEFWERMSNDRVFQEIGDIGADPKVVLRRVQEIVTREDLSRYDLVMRSWATHEPEVARRVESVASRRNEYVGHQFRRLGFRGADLEIRTRAFVVTTSMWSIYNRNESSKLRTRQLAALLEMLTDSG